MHSRELKMGVDKQERKKDESMAAAPSIKSVKRERLQ